MTIRPTVSILLPVRNAETTLPACIESIRAQTLDDWECIAVDDHSSDRSRALLEGWARRDPRVRVFHAPEPGGLVCALETARREARAPILARHDADDRSLPERLERQVAALDADADAAVIGCLTETPGPMTDGMRRYLDWLGACTDAGTCTLEIWIESPIAHPTAVMRAAAIDRAGGYRDLGWPEDYDLWFRVLRDGGRMYNLAGHLYVWMDRPDRLSRRDARYGPGAFLRCRVHHLRKWLAAHAPGRRLIVWGAGRDGRRLAAEWESEIDRPGPDAAEITAFVDIDPRKLGRTRRGRRVLTFEGARNAHHDAFYLLAVGVPGARSLIRGQLLAAGLKEGRDFLCLH